MTPVILTIMLCIVCLGVGYWAHSLISKRSIQDYKSRIREFSEKAEVLSKNYDAYRLKYLDLDDRYQEVKNMEQTYRVAFQEWKAKYEDLKQESKMAPSESNERKEDTTPPTPDKDDAAILYVSWKRKAKKWEKEWKQVSEAYAADKEHWAEQEEQLEHLQGMEMELLSVKNQLSGIIHNIQSTTQGDLVDDEHEIGRSTVFDLDK